MIRQLRQIALYVFFPLLILLVLNRFAAGPTLIYRYILAAAPILVVLIIMTIFRVGGQVAGPVGEALVMTACEAITVAAVARITMAGSSESGTSAYSS